MFGAGALDRLGGLARELGFRRTLLVADAGMLAAGYVEAARSSLAAAGVSTDSFHDFGANPDSRMVALGAERARGAGVDSLVGLGGGSSMDCAKGIAFLLAGGGDMAEYRGYGKARGTLPPSIGVPTTAGTGSEAQSYALISDPETHDKMACGDPGAAFRVAILDPVLTVSQPAHVTAVAGYDALSHAVESYVTQGRNPVSELFAYEAFRLLSLHYCGVLARPEDLEARSAMLLGAHYAGRAIEASMLGAAHACANPLSARYGTEHGVAIGLLLPHVVRWNAPAVETRYADLLRAADRGGTPAGEALAAWLEDLAVAGGLPRRLRAVGVSESELPALAAAAAQQWTGRHNPRPLDAPAALDLYRRAL